MERLAERKLDIDDELIPRVIRGYNHCPDTLNRQLQTELIEAVAQKMKTYREGSSFKVIAEIFQEVSEVPNLDLIVQQEALNGMVSTVLRAAKQPDFQRFHALRLLQAFTNLARQRFSLSGYQEEIKQLLRKSFLDSTIAKHCTHSIELFFAGLEGGFFSYAADLPGLLSHLDKHEQTWTDKDLINVLKLTVISHNCEPAAAKQKRLALLQSKISTAIKKKYQFFIAYEFLHQFSPSTLEKERLKVQDSADLLGVQAKVDSVIAELLKPENSIRYRQVLPVVAQALIEFAPEENGLKLQTYLDSLEEIGFSHIFLKLCDTLHLTSVYRSGREVPEAFPKLIFKLVSSNLDRITRIGLFSRVMRFISSSGRSVFKTRAGAVLSEFAELIEEIDRNVQILSNETVTSIEFTTMRKFYLKVSSLGFADKPFLRELAIRITKRSYNELDLFSLLEHFDLLLEIDIEVSKEFAKSPAVLLKMADVQKMLSTHSIASLSTLNRLMRVLLFLVEETPNREQTSLEKVERNTVMWVLKGGKRAPEQKSLSKEDYIRMIEQAKDKVRRAHPDRRGPRQKGRVQLRLLEYSQRGEHLPHPLHVPEAGRAARGVRRRSAARLRKGRQASLETHRLQSRVEPEDLPPEHYAAPGAPGPQRPAPRVSSAHARGYVSLLFKDFVYHRKRIRQFEVHELYLRLLKFVRVLQIKVINKALQQIYTHIRLVDRSVADRLLGLLEHFRVCHDQTLAPISDFYAESGSIDDTDLVRVAVTFAFLNFQPTKKFQSRLSNSHLTGFLKDGSIETKEKYKCIWYCILKGLLGTQKLM